MRYDKQNKSQGKMQLPTQREAPPASTVQTVAPQTEQTAETAKPRSHRVAKAAYDCVAARRQGFPEKKTYGALAHKLPVLILQNGLAQATGFLLAKNKAEHRALLDDLAHVLRETDESGCDNRDALHATVIAADTGKTMHLTRRALEASGWMKRYVQGVLNVDATGEVTTEENAA